MRDSEIKRFPSKEMCKKCQCETWHKILNQVIERESDEESGIWTVETSYTLQCLGCDNVCLLTEFVCSEDGDPQTGELEVQKNIYPIPYKNDREPIDKIYHAPKDVALVYGETIKAMNSAMTILTAIGIRSTIEAIAIDQNITVWGIEAKIKKMVKLNIITPDGSKLLMLVKDIGNKAAHKIKKHHHDDLSLCIDIVEDVIKNLYILPKEAENVREIIDGKWKRAESNDKNGFN